MLEVPQRLRLPIDSMTSQAAVGDRVEAGDLLAESFDDDRSYRCCHAPLSGTVVAIGGSTNGHTTNDNGFPRFLELLIDKESLASQPCNQPHRADLSGDEIVDIARRSGLKGMGGGMFPTFVKLSPNTPIDWVIINGCESEPYLTCDHRVLEEYRDEVECGMRLAMRAVGATNGTIVEGENDFLDGYEPRLIRNELGRDVPRGGRPSDVGVVVLNVQSARSLHQAVCEQRPLVDRVVTVDGNAIRRPGNYVVPLGTEIRHVLNVCGIDWEQTPTVINGGPVMGRRVELDSTVTAGTGGILALTSDEISDPSPGPCIRCGSCQAVCPRDLPAGQLVRQPSNLLFECVECGVCQIACPAERPLLEDIRKVKSRLHGEE